MAVGQGDVIAALIVSGSLPDWEIRIQVGAIRVVGLGAILVVEDEGRLLKMLTRALGEAGYWTIAASDGGRALSTLRHRSPNIAGLITDVGLGSGIDGWQLAREPRMLCPTISVVYTSGTESGHWSYQGVSGSMMLAKPFTTSRLADVVEALLNEPRPNRFANDSF